jgi:hypothetical protein
MKSLLLLFCLLLGFDASVLAAGLSGKSRTNFIESFTSNCLDTQKKNPENARATSELLKTYCTCSALYTVDRTPESELSLFKQLTGTYDKQREETLSVEATNYCRAKIAESNSFLAATLSDCIARASENNKNLPMWVDKVTKFNAMMCYQDGTRIVVRYAMQLPNITIRSDEKLIASHTNSIKSQTCSLPEMRNTLNSADVEYTYSDSSLKEGLHNSRF